MIYHQSFVHINHKDKPCFMLGANIDSHFQRPKLNCSTLFRYYLLYTKINKRVCLNSIFPCIRDKRYVLQHLGLENLIKWN